MCESWKREVGKEMFARGSLPSAPKNTLPVPNYCAGEGTSNNRLLSPRPPARRGNKIKNKKTVHVMLSHDFCHQFSCVYA